MSENLIEQNAKPKFLRVMASIVSYVCHPVFMPVIMAYVLLRLSPDGFGHTAPKQLGLWFINIGFTGIFFPMFSILLMKPLGFISSYHMPTARERTIPLMVTMIFYFWVSHVFNSMQGVTIPLVLKVLLLGNFWGVILLFLINIFTKISMHTAAAGGMMGILLVQMIMPGTTNMIVPLMIALVIAAIIGAARLILGVHQRGDVWLGYIIGIIVQLGAYVYMR